MSRARILADYVSGGTFNQINLSAAESGTSAIRFQNDQDEADAAISTFTDADQTAIVLGSNFYRDADSYERFADDKKSSAVVLKGGEGSVGFFVGGAGADALEKVSISESGDLTVSGDFVPSSALSSRNLIINGAMNVSARGTSETKTTNGYGKAPDRMKINVDGLASGVNISQDSSGPNGFKNSYKLVTQANDAMDTDWDLTFFSTRIEAQDLQQLAYGTSDAKTTVLSFYVKTNLAGDYSIALKQPDNSNKTNAQGYTVSSSDATSENWVRYSIVIVGDTSGVINDDTGTGLEIVWGLGCATQYRGGTNSTSWQTYNNNLVANTTVNVMASTSSYWQITGIQLEVGSNATPFEHRSYGDELARCQRYYEVIAGDNGKPISMSYAYSSTQIQGVLTYSEKRITSPTLELSAADNYFQMLVNGAGHSFHTLATADTGSFTNMTWYATRSGTGGAFSLTAGMAGHSKVANASGRVAISAEL